MCVVLEAMSDAGVLAGLPRVAAQDMAIHTMLVCTVHIMVPTEISVFLCIYCCTIYLHMLRMVAVVHRCYIVSGCILFVP